LKEGVAVPDLYDPTVNPLLRDVLTHYGVAALPCRIQDPDRKGKVESGIGYTNLSRGRSTVRRFGTRVAHIASFPPLGVAFMYLYRAVQASPKGRKS
jgi:transposase